MLDAFRALGYDRLAERRATASPKPSASALLYVGMTRSARAARAVRRPGPRPSSAAAPPGLPQRAPARRSVSTSSRLCPKPWRRARDGSGASSLDAAGARLACSPCCTLRSTRRGACDRRDEGRQDLPWKTRPAPCGVSPARGRSAAWRCRSRASPSMATVRTRWDQTHAPGGMSPDLARQSRRAPCTGRRAARSPSRVRCATRRRATRWTGTRIRGSGCQGDTVGESDAANAAAARSETEICSPVCSRSGPPCGEGLPRRAAPRTARAGRSPRCFRCSCPIDEDLGRRRRGQPRPAAARIRRTAGFTVVDYKTDRPERPEAFERYLEEQLRPPTGPRWPKPSPSRRRRGSRKDLVACGPSRAWSSGSTRPAPRRRAPDAGQLSFSLTS